MSVNIPGVAEDLPVRHSEFEGYIRRHEADEDAHGKLVRRVRSEIFTVVDGYGQRVDALERLVWMGLGMATLLGVMIAGGTVGLVIELARGR